MNEIGQSAGKNLDWLAGFLEGDGSIILQKQRMSGNRVIYSPAIKFSNTDALIIEHCQQILNENNIGSFIHAKQTTNGVAFDLTVKGFKRVSTLLPLISDRLFGKKRAIAIILSRWLESRASTGNHKTYTEYEIYLAENITKLHDPGYPQRLNARLRENADEDIVRTVQRCAELSRNEIAKLII